MDRVLRQGEEVATTVAQQADSRKQQIRKGIIKPASFQSLVNNPDDKVVRTYADRSINRELDQVLSIIRSKHAGRSNLEFKLQGSKTLTYDFDKLKSDRFHALVSKREVGDPVVYAGRVRQLDRDRLNGKIVNLENDKTIFVHFLDAKDFVKVHPYLGNNSEMLFIGAPVIEYGAFDPNAGDIYFIDLLSSQ